MIKARGKTDETDSTFHFAAFRTRVISGKEQSRMLFGKLILQKPNIVLMDEPINHLYMEIYWITE